MNSSEQTTVATLAVFFALIFLLIIVTMCCILRRGCRKETTQEGNKRYRFRNADWEKSGTLTSSETRVTEAMATDSSLTGATVDRNANGLQGNTAGLVALVRIEEETHAQICNKSEDESEEDDTPGDSMPPADEAESKMEAVLEASEGISVLVDSKEALYNEQLTTARDPDSHLNCHHNTKEAKSTETTMQDKIEESETTAMLDGAMRS